MAFIDMYRKRKGRIPMKRVFVSAWFLVVSGLIIVGCSGSKKNDPGSTPTYTVTYIANGATTGTVPTDSTRYTTGQMINVIGNLGNLSVSGYLFADWNTKADGSGTYFQSSTTQTVGDSDITLYAQWSNSSNLHFVANASGYTVSKVGTISGNFSIPSSYIGLPVTQIANSGFSSCTGLTSIAIPNSVTVIGSYAFQGCTGLTSAIISNGVVSIGNNAFAACSCLSKVAIPSSVTSIGNFVFNGCSGLTSIEVDVTNPNYTSISGVLFNKAGTSIVASPAGLTSYTLPSSLTSIGDQAFRGCTGLTNITIPNSIISIGQQAFDGCTSLTNITIPNSVTSIGNQSFSGCTSLTNITIPNSVTSIADFAFISCTNLTSITIPNSVTSIGSQVFGFCTSLTNIVIPSSITSINSHSFSYCSSLTSITMPDSITSIADFAFMNCTSLTSITIPSSVASIGDWAFDYCSGLTDVTMQSSTPPALNASSNVFYGASSSLKIHVSSSAAVTTYQAATGWSVYSSKIVTP
jgi:hypothetical protein